MTEILMPKATAVWLIDNTSLTFDQIAEFCGLHPLEVRGIADGDVAAGVRGADPIANDQLTREEIEKAEKSSAYRMVAKKSKHEEKMQTKRTGPRYTPLSRRQERPNAIAWLVKNHPELTDGQISRLIGTTKTTIQAVRDRSHWNASNISAEDPVALGLCSQIELDDAVLKAAKKKRKADEAAGIVDEGESLKPVAESLAEPEAEPEDPRRRRPVDADAVFANFPTDGGDAEKDGDEKP